MARADYRVLWCTGSSCLYLLSGPYQLRERHLQRFIRLLDTRVSHKGKLRTMSLPDPTRWLPENTDHITACSTNEADSTSSGKRCSRQSVQREGGGLTLSREEKHVAV